MEKNVRNGGFTIVEIMVSLLLISIALIAIASVFPRMTAHSKVMREVEDAYAIAAHVLDSLHQESVRDVDLFSDQDNHSWSPYAIRNNTSFDVNYVIDLKDFFKQATVTVSWEKFGPHEITLSGVVR